MWLYAFFFAPSGNPDRLEDRSWPKHAEKYCNESLENIADLPSVLDISSPAERADLIEAATTILEIMVNNLKKLDGGSNNDKALIENWLEDWSTYLKDRRIHAERLRTEGDVQPLLTALPDGSSALKRMNGFARVNDMEMCLDPADF
tara:strand:- start:43 stop:483 length:441 start_codon:yes stop_codon:yes gene_type:complete